MSSELVKAKIIARLDELVHVIWEKLPNKDFRTPKLTFELKGTLGGQASVKDWEIRINLPLASANLDFYLSQVIAHELAHLLDWTLYREQGHGRTWKRIMRSVFGLTPDRTHCLDVSEVKLKKHDTYLYSCPCGYPHHIKSNMHKKIQGLKRTLGCATCRKVIVFDKYIGKT